MGDEPFLAGERVSLADLMVIPLLYYFRRVPEGEAPLGRTPEPPPLDAPHRGAPELPGHQTAGSKKGV